MDLIDVGYGRRAHGIGGEVLIRPTTDDPERWVTGAVMVTNESPPRDLDVVSVRPHHDDLLVQFATVDDRDAAQMLRGVTFRIAADERRPLAKDEFWPDQLIGCAVVGPERETLGSVVDVEFGEAQDRLVVETPDDRRIEVPLVAALVKAVDLEARTIFLTPPEGLF